MPQRAGSDLAAIRNDCEGVRIAQSPAAMALAGWIPLPGVFVWEF